MPSDLRATASFWEDHDGTAPIWWGGSVDLAVIEPAPALPFMASANCTLTLRPAAGNPVGDAAALTNPAEADWSPDHLEHLELPSSAPFDSPTYIVELDPGGGAAVRTTRPFKIREPYLTVSPSDGGIAAWGAEIVLTPVGCTYPPYDQAELVLLGAQGAALQLNHPEQVDWLPSLISGVVLPSRDPTGQPPLIPVDSPPGFVIEVRGTGGSVRRSQPFLIE